jgi:preprotein translocase subunit YajC
VTTIGGISGRIIAIKEESDTLVLETGTDRNKINIKRWAISTVDTQVAAPASEAKDAKDVKDTKDAK